MRRDSLEERVPACGDSRRAHAADLARAVLVVLAAVLAFFQSPALGQVDPNEIASSRVFLNLEDPNVVRDEQGVALLTFARFDANDTLVWVEGFRSVDAWCEYARSDPDLAGAKTEQTGWMLSGGDEDIFWPLQALLYLCPAYRSIVDAIESRPVVYNVLGRAWVAPSLELTDGANACYQPTAAVSWNPAITGVFDRTKRWHRFPPLVGLAHELVHAHQRVVEDKYTYASPMQVDAMKGENLARYAFFTKVPGHGDVRPRPGNLGYYLNSQVNHYFDDIDWGDWSPRFTPLLDVFEEE